MAIALTKAEREAVEMDRTWIECISQADLIVAQHQRTGERIAIWRRPLKEMEARELPARIILLAFEVETFEDIKEFYQLMQQ